MLWMMHTFNTQVVAVDRSPSTVTSIARLMDALSEHMGTDATAARVLPVLCPLLAVHALNGRQYKDVLSIIQVRACACVASSVYLPV